MESKTINCGFGVTITPTTRTERGLDYSDYKIENKMREDNGCSRTY